MRNTTTFCNKKTLIVETAHIADTWKMVECYCAAPSCQCHRLGLTQKDEAK